MSLVLFSDLKNCFTLCSGLLTAKLDAKTFFSSCNAAYFTLEIFSLAVVPEEIIENLVNRNII